MLYAPHCHRWCLVACRNWCQGINFHDPCHLLACRGNNQAFIFTKHEDRQSISKLDKLETTTYAVEECSRSFNKLTHLAKITDTLFCSIKQKDSHTISNHLRMGLRLLQKGVLWFESHPFPSNSSPQHPYDPNWLELAMSCPNYRPVGPRIHHMSQEDLPRACCIP